MANEKIEVGYRHIGSLGVDYHHKSYSSHT